MWLELVAIQMESVVCLSSQVTTQLTPTVVLLLMNLNQIYTKIIRDSLCNLRVRGGNSQDSSDSVQQSVYDAMVTI